MATSLQIREIEELAEMVRQFPLIQHLNPTMEPARYEELLRQMVPQQYRMVGVFDGDTCLGLSGYWMGTKLYSGKYLEVDNFVVDEQSRSKGIGKLLLDWLTAEASKHRCETMMLDAYVVNHAAHKFYLREGFVIKGFHFLKRLG
ncbi:GNAT family N-acetyltransferase [Rufibacter sediminis]|uniref:GNAT family N-acetyltransferase n=1 Tax=Rufibacter sediminis TaxID=2762756 RepID=A0ABR6VU36_9BACT|nr:GNAT family N-acetyltransferase [Rufibacter sediminis]MBC3540709.1 GNAT family N-acetyltransferase [Rufibacter sediminis]